MNFFTKNPNLKRIFFYGQEGGGEVGGRGARVSEFFFTKNPHLKKKLFFFGGGGGGGRGRGRWLV